MMCLVDDEIPFDGVVYVPFASDGIGEGVCNDMPSPETALLVGLFDHTVGVP